MLHLHLIAEDVTKGEHQFCLFKGQELSHFLRSSSLSLPDNQLTNIANGHSSKGEKLNGCKTEAMTLEQYFTKCALPPLDFSDLKNVVLISINKGYPQCMELEESKQKDAIREMARGFWKLKVDHPDYLYAMYHQRVWLHIQYGKTVNP